ncbi:MAG: LPS assembly protein LptD, partial [Magnetococcales bacterium]|nr:LPS assembly protein LptD [Magnetococcales bacterium]
MNVFTEAKAHTGLRRHIGRISTLGILIALTAASASTVHARTAEPDSVLSAIHTAFSPHTPRPTVAPFRVDPVLNALSKSFTIPLPDIAPKTVTFTQHAVHTAALTTVPSPTVTPLSRQPGTRHQDRTLQPEQPLTVEQFQQTEPPLPAQDEEEKHTKIQRRRTWTREASDLQHPVPLPTAIPLHITDLPRSVVEESTKMESAASDGGSVDDEPPSILAALQQEMERLARTASDGGERSTPSQWLEVAFVEQGESGTLSDSLIRRQPAAESPVTETRIAAERGGSEPESATQHSRNEEQSETHASRRTALPAPVPRRVPGRQTATTAVSAKHLLASRSRRTLEQEATLPRGIATLASTEPVAIGATPRPSPAPVQFGTLSTTLTSPATKSLSTDTGTLMVADAEEALQEEPWTTADNRAPDTPDPESAESDFEETGSKKISDFISGLDSAEELEELSAEDDAFLRGEELPDSEELFQLDRTLTADNALENSLEKAGESFTMDESDDALAESEEDKGILPSLPALKPSLTETIPAQLRAPVDLEADHMEHDNEKKTIKARGNVHISQGKHLDLRADEISYGLIQQEVEAKGNIRIDQDGNLFESERVKLNISKETGVLDKVRVDMKGPGGHATAEKVELFGKKRVVLHDAAMTNCDCEPPPWKIASGKIEVDQEENEVIARHARLYLGGIPVLYTPYWQQPLRPERKSGLLVPSVRVTDSAGFEADIPYYWNIAADRDATLTLHPTSKRGVMGKMQFRFLTPSSEGVLDLHAIKDTADDETRGLVAFNHTTIGDNWWFETHLEATKTRDFINDFQQGVIDHQDRQLRSFMRLKRSWSRESGFTELTLSTRWTEDLSQDNDQLTIQQLPHINLNNYLGFSLGSAGGQFTTDLTLDNYFQLSGDMTQRADLYPVIEMDVPLYVGQLSLAGGPRVTGWQIHGNPTKVNTTRSQEEFRHREAGMFRARLETMLTRTYQRDADAKSDFHTFRHTLEPTVQYVVNGATDQSLLPGYDHSLKELTTRNLFDENLYSGIDRISTGHWVSFGLTTRLIAQHDDTGVNEEWFNFSIGQRWAPSGHREYQDNNAFSDVVAS